MIVVKGNSAQKDGHHHMQQLSEMDTNKKKEGRWPGKWVKPPNKQKKVTLILKLTFFYYYHHFLLLK